MVLNNGAVTSARSFKIAIFSIGILTIVFATIHAISFDAMPVFPLDDSYITLHNAMALIAGDDSNFPLVSPLSGTTSPIHLLLVTFLLFVFPPLLALHVANWIGIYLFVLGTYRLSIINNLKHWQAISLVFLGLILARMPYQLLNGLETGLALAGLIWAINLSCDKSSRHPWLLPLICGQLPFLRPELVVFSILLVLCKALDVWKCSDFPTTIKRLVYDLLILFIATLPWMFWFFIATGSVFPYTITAKRLFFSEGCLPKAIKVDWIVLNIKIFFLTIGVFSLSALGLIFSWVGRAGIFFFFIFISAYYYFFPGALGHYSQRYLYIFIPFLIQGLVSLWQFKNRRLHILVLGLVVISLTQSAFEFPARWDHYQRTLDFTKQELEGVADWCRNNLSPSSILLVHDVGYISYATSFHLIDFVGLKTPFNIHYHNNITWPSCGLKRAEAVSRIAIEGKASYLIMLNGWDSIYHITHSLQRLGWILTPMRSSGVYQVYQLTLDNNYKNNIEYSLR